MERKEFFTMAQKATVFMANFAKLPAEPIAEIIVEHNGIKYYPQALQVGFNDKGEVVNTAILHDLHQNSVTYARLENVVQSV
ncbi:MAG: hypothetical protein J6K17_00105 [Oscillospiraceae bacterium]|nr:hypothetical protein [Oscillospiraceae bacterium]